MPPPWRGQAGSTFQKWTFPDNARFGVQPDAGFSNPVDTPVLNVSGNATWAGGNWTLGPRVGNTLRGRLVFTIPNFDQTDMSKEVWTGVTYFGVVPAPEVSIAPQGGGPVFSENVGERSFTNLPNGRTFMHSVFTFDRCPEAEDVIVAAPPGMTVVIDQVVIDTRCFAPIPEPACGVGGAILLSRVLARRRRAEQV